jgi:hypothetical protein
MDDLFGGWFSSDDSTGSWLDDLGGIFGGGGGLVGGVISAALTGFALNKITNSITKSSDNVPATTQAVDEGVRLQVPSSVDQKVPVLYGEAFFGGIITEAVMTNNNKTMTYVLTLSERTGSLLSTNFTSPSIYTFKNIYWNDNRIVFKSDGFTVDYTVDRDGNIDYNPQGLARVWCYAGSSSEPVYPEGYSGTALPSAYNLISGWTYNHTMNNLIFAVVSIDYNRDKGMTGIPDISFNIENSLTMPGDVLADYMSNTRYGAGIPLTDIYSQ